MPVTLGADPRQLDRVGLSPLAKGSIVPALGYDVSDAPSRLPGKESCTRL
jgi:hypothetical protein